MLLNPQEIGKRDKSILAGLFLSKYDSAGLKKLGFESFTEAFNVIGYALGARPASIKRILPKRYAELERNQPYVAFIGITPIAKG